MNRRSFIKTGLIFVPTYFVTKGIGGTIALSSLDSEVYAWMELVRAASGHYTSLSVVANDTWIKMVKAAGIRSKIHRANTYVGSDLTCVARPLITDAQNVYDVLNNFVAGDYSESTGLTGGGTRNLDTSTLPTGFMPSDNNGHMALYNRWNLIDANVPMGAGTGTNFDYLIPGNTGSMSHISMTNTGTAAIMSGDTDPRGFYVGTRTTATDL